MGGGRVGETQTGKGEGAGKGVRGDGVGWGDVLLFHRSFYKAYHLGDEGKFEHPRHTWTYANERFVGRMSRLALSSRHALAPAKRSKAICDMYALGMSLMFFHRR